MQRPKVSKVWVWAISLMLLGPSFRTDAQTMDGQSEDLCGEAVTLTTREGAGTTYSLAGRLNSADAVLILLPGGGGFLDLDSRGCPRKLKGNSLVRTRSLSHRHGLMTALVDAPSDHQGVDGLGGYRTAPTR